MHKVTYEVEMTPENAGKLDAINHILFGGDYAMPPGKEVSSKGEPEPAEEAPKGMPLSELKKLAKPYAKEFGDDFLKACAKAVGAEPASSMGKTLSAIDPDKFDEFLELLAKGPAETEDDGWDEDDEPAAQVSADTVKDALKAYAKNTGKDEAKAIMEKYKVRSLSKVDECDDETLAAILKAVS